jgi:hypothetical protein
LLFTVPLIRPVPLVVEILSPDGRLPLINDQVKEELPPVAVKDGEV